MISRKSQCQGAFHLFTTKESASVEMPESSSNKLAPRFMLACIGSFVAFSMFIA